MAIIYTYPNLPLSSLSADDLLVITDIDNTNNNPTKYVKLSDIATYITNTGTGTGTTNTLTLWSDGPNGVLGDSILTQDVGATALTVTGNFIATGTGNFTSQVTIPATPGINTDAASKGYVDTQVAGIPAGLVFKGNWDASSTPGGSPDLTNAIYKVVGNYYVVSVAGNATPNGPGELPNSWDVGDWCVYIEQGGTDRWEKLDQTFIAGSGATGQAAFFTTTNSVGGDDNFYWDNTNKRLGIGTTSPDRDLEVESTGAGEMCITGTTGSRLFFRPTVSYSPGGNFGILVTGGSSPEFLSTMKFSGYNTSSGGVNTIMTLKGDGDVSIFPRDEAASSGSGILYFKNVDDNSTTINGASIRTVDSNSNPSGADMRFQVATDAGVLFDAVTIDSNGFMGIGTTAPDQPLEVNGNIKVGTSFSSQKNIYFGDTNFSIRTENNYTTSNLDNLRFAVADNADAGFRFTNVNDDELLYIKSENGNVGVGTTNPDAKLQVAGNIHLSSNTGPILTLTDTDTTIGSGSRIAHIAFVGSEIGGETSRIACVSETSGGEGGLKFYTGASLTQALELNISQNATFAGNVGIKDNPSFSLDVNVASSRARFKAATGDVNIELSSINGHDYLIQSKSDSSFVIYDEDESSERLKIDSSGNSTFAGNVILPQYSNLFFGTNSSNQLSLANNLSGSILKQNGSGTLEISCETDVLIRSNTGGGLGGEALAKFTKDGSIELYYDDNKKFETTSSGVKIPTAGDGITLVSPDGNTTRTISIDNSGNLVVSP